jgi:hypothetical protein
MCGGHKTDRNAVTRCQVHLHRKPGPGIGRDGGDPVQQYDPGGRPALFPYAADDPSPHGSGVEHHHLRHQAIVLRRRSLTPSAWRAPALTRRAGA